MSWLGRVSIVIIVIGLAFIAGIHLYRNYEERLSQDDISAGFNETSMPSSAPTVEIPVFKRFPENDQMSNDIFLEDTPLAPEQAQEQARQTITSILEDYRDNPQLQAFYQDIKQNTGQSIDLASMSSGNMGELLKQYPQLQEIIAKHAQDPQFTQSIQEIFSNPEFVRSVVVLQQTQTVSK